MFLRLGGVAFVIMLLIWLYAVFDSITAPAERVRGLPKAVWVIIVLLFTDLGAICWFLFGRPRATAGARAARPTNPFGWESHGGRVRPASKVAPDDDPDFLRRLDDQMRRDRRDPDDPRP